MPEISCHTINNLKWDLQTPMPQGGLKNYGHIWQIPVLSHLSSINDLKSILSKEEIERSAVFQNEDKAQHYIVSCASLRILLGRYSNTPPNEIVFRSGSNKKPFLALNDKTNLHFSVSHSDDFLLIAISDLPVGIDLEKTVSSLNFSEMLPLFFSRAEIEFIATAKSPHLAFYSLWTRKEALVKATAKGVDNDLALVPCLDGTHLISPKIISSAYNWKVSSFCADDNYLGSVACHSEIQSMSFRQVDRFFFNY